VNFSLENKFKVDDIVFTYRIPKSHGCNHNLKSTVTLLPEIIENEY